MSKHPVTPQGFKPLLAAAADLDRLVYPLIASPKLDGIRATIHADEMGAPMALARSMKLLPSAHVQRWFAERPELIGLDGEITVGPANAPNVMQTTTSAVMSHARDDFEFTFHVFDDWSTGCASYVERLRAAVTKVQAYYRNGKHVAPGSVEMVPQAKLKDRATLDAYESHAVGQGYEGVMLRSGLMGYKFGRSTVNEGALLKVKRFADLEATIVGVEPQMHNTNEATTNELGRTKRSTAKAGLVAKDTLGAFECVTITGPFGNVKFTVGNGPGLDDELRKRLWEQREALVHKGVIIKVQYFPLGCVDAPRFPKFVGFRDPVDMDAP